MQENFIKNYINIETEKIWDAYLSIDVDDKTGHEDVSPLISKCLKETTQFLGLQDFF